MSKEPLSTISSEQFRLDRCKALADGVFAIVVTLLVLGIDIPSDHNFSEQGLFAFLERIGFHLMIYGVSFWLAATYWVQHAAIMHYYRHGNRTVVWLNLFFLFPVTLLPFVTELKGSFRDTVGDHALRRCANPHWARAHCALELFGVTSLPAKPHSRRSDPEKSNLADVCEPCHDQFGSHCRFVPKCTSRHSFLFEHSSVLPVTP